MISSNWKEVILGGAFLTKIAELSFLLISKALSRGIIQ
ncbi:MAG: hypothetical protein ACJAUR_001272 [Ulvibacter sp.]|jgi:hypothetical protein